MLPIEDLDDITLVIKAQNGDNVSMEILLKRYQGLARSKSRKFFLTDGTNEDLYQEGLLGVFKAIQDFDSTKNDNFTGFVALCVSRKIIDAIRTSTREKHKMLNDAISIYALDDNFSNKYNDDPINKYTVFESTEEFYNKLDSLIKPIQLKILKLYLDGYSYNEIAEKMEMPVKKIDNSLNAVKIKIKKNKDIFDKQEHS